MSAWSIRLVRIVAPPLIFGRNEGLRVTVRLSRLGKFDVTGAVTDMPAEPARSRLKEHARIKAYPCAERNGMLWTYMGTGQRRSAAAA